ncbi:MAG: urate hydroxylase PuuD, partial [Gemmatimonadales bacterium]
LGAAAWSTPWAVTILSGGLLGTLMFLNVWLVIWPKQKLVIAAASGGGGGPNPAVATAGRRSFLASRTNVVMSVPMIFFMTAATHLPPTQVTNLGGYWAGILLIAALLEVNALAATTGATTKPIEKVRGVILTGIAVGVVAFAMLRWCVSA